MYLSGNYPKLNSIGNSFVNNQAIYGSGGALYLHGNFPFLNTSGNSFISNKANVNGGAVYVSGNYPSQNASGNSFIDNKAIDRGDDLYMFGNYVSLNASGNSIIGMSASQNGGTWSLAGNHVTSNASGNSFVSSNNLSYGIESLDLTLTMCTSANIIDTTSTHTEITTAKLGYTSPDFQTVEPQSESKELRNKALEISIIMYTFVAISIILAALIIIVLLVKLYGVIRRKQRKKPIINQLPSDGSTQANEGISWRGHSVYTDTTIQMTPNIVYGRYRT